MALNSSKIVPVSKPKNGRALVDEKIDERILRLLGLEDVFDIDYDTYASLLKERMGSARMRKQTLPTEEVELLTNEWKKIKGKKGRFKVKKITAESFKKGTAVGMNLGKQKFLGGIKPLALPQATDKMVGKNDIQEIIDLLAEIIKNLTQQNKIQKDSNERERKESENVKRALAESKLEKGFALAIKTAEKVIAPVKSMLSRIIDFFMAIFFGKVFLKLLDWFADPENKKKINSLFRFFGDHWPKLLALYLRFGTGFGKFVGGLTNLVFFGARKLLQIVAQMVGAKGAAKFLGGKGGKLVAAGLSVATTVGTTMALSKGIENFAGQGEDKQPKIPTFKGGGFANFKNLFGMFGNGSLSSGYVSGEKGVDKVPAMLSDGEFVMSRGAVEKYGVNTLEAMNAAGGGTNRPKMISGTTYAAGGGMIGGSPDFWKIAALASKEDSINPQGQADVAQSIYNRINLGSYPGGKSISAVITAPGQYQPTFSNPSKWKSIKDRVSAINATGNEKKIDMAAKSITNPALQRESAKFVGGRTDFQGESQKKYMKPSDVTRGKSHNFFGWFYDAKLPKPAPIPNIVSSQSKQIQTPPMKPDMNGSKNQPNIIERVKNFIFSPSQPKEPRYAQGGMVQSPMQLTKMPLRAKNITPPSAPPVLVSTTNKTSTAMPSIPSSPGVPKAPSFNSIHSNNERKRILAIHGVA